MKVVLLKDVPGVGRKNDVKNVSDGYALNLLIPKKLAVAGTLAGIAQAARLRSEQETERRIQEDLRAKNLSSLDGVTIEMTEKASEKGHLFAGIHKGAIVDALKKQKGIDLMPDVIDLPHPIKEAGTHTIPAAVQNKRVAFTLVVKPME